MSQYSKGHPIVQEIVRNRKEICLKALLSRQIPNDGEYLFIINVFH